MLSRHQNSITSNSNWEMYLKLGGSLNPFGSVISDRTWSDQSRQYRFGFNGKEKDFETASDNYDFGARIYDGRLGRWLTLDKHWYNYLDLSPYNFCFNNPIDLIDPDGMDVVFAQGDKVSNSQHRRMKMQILLLRLFSINYRRMYRDLNKSDIVYTFISDDGTNVNGDYGEFKLKEDKIEKGSNNIYINVDRLSKESIYKYRQILAHESGHAWRSCVGLDKPFEREALPNCNSRNFGESEESFNKRNKRCQIERQRIECQNNINATEWRAKVELAADHIQNIVMSDLGRSPFFRKCKPELTYGPVLVFFKSFSLGGGTNCNTREGFFGSEFKASYYDTKRDIRVEFGLKEKSYDINNCVLDLSLRKNQIKLENYIKKYNRNKHDK